MILETACVEDIARQDADVLAKVDGPASQGVPEGELICSTGAVHDESVLTINGDHFERIPGLEVETY